MVENSPLSGCFFFVVNTLRCSKSKAKGAPPAMQTSCAWGEEQPGSLNLMGRKRHGKT